VAGTTSVGSRHRCGVGLDGGEEVLSDVEVDPSPQTGPLGQHVTDTVHLARHRRVRWRPVERMDHNRAMTRVATADSADGLAAADKGAET